MSVVGTCSRCGSNITEDDWDGAAETYLCPSGCGWGDSEWPVQGTLVRAEEETE